MENVTQKKSDNPEYVEDLITEYADLQNRIQNLEEMVEDYSYTRYDKDFSPVYLYSLERQLFFMYKYLDSFETRVELENIDLEIIYGTLKG